MLKGVTFAGEMFETQGALTKRISSIIEETPESTPSPLSLSFDRERRWLSMKLETGPSDTEPVQCPDLGPPNFRTMVIVYVTELMFLLYLGSNVQQEKAVLDNGK